jgi:hypothetical protein
VTPRRSRRRPWTRALLLALFVASLPFTWTEEISPGCDGHPRGMVTVKTGFGVLFSEPQVALITLALLCVALLLEFTAPRVKRSIAILADFASALACAMLFMLADFAAMFAFGTKIVLHAAGYVGLGSLVAAGVEAIVRAILEIREWIEQRRVN